MNKVYSRIDWKNEPSIATPLNETNLNKIDYALNVVDTRVVEHETTKVGVDAIQNYVADWTMNTENGIITITKVNGSKVIFDLNIEKIPVKFELTKDGILKMTTDDGTVFTANIAEIIPVLTFNDSDQIAVTVSGSGINKTYSFTIKGNSITDSMIEANYLANLRLCETNTKTYESAALEAKNKAKQSADEASVYASNALQSKNSAKSSSDLAEDWAVGDNPGSVEPSATYNSKYFAEQAKSEKNAATQKADSAASSETKAKTYMTNAKAYMDSALESKNSALSAKNDAESAKNSANTYKNDALSASTLAEHWAIGGDTEHATSNSKYYASLSQSYANGTGDSDRTDKGIDNAKTYSEAARASAVEAAQKLIGQDAILAEVNKRLNIASFSVDDNGFLIYTDNSGYTFTIDSNGFLNYTVV